MSEPLRDKSIQGDAVKKVLWMSFAAALLTGCVGHYPQPDIHAPHAVLEAEEGDSQLLFSRFEAYWAFYDVGCTDTEETGVLGQRKEGAGARFLLKPDRRIFINVLGSGGLRKTDGYYSQYCANVGSFIPAAGITYRVSQQLRAGDCAISIIDTRTGKPADSFRREVGQGQCRLNTRDN
ncbi:putative uncharacterized protein [Pseudomonas sp. StFLB209]|uniref:hypothetical protein n=1 Tax=Pseudomonas sp. StFLB209 TaxID=1028989 RepID=UPI0004F80796|nr:hypothetical protein [Pseudomonas sp. StFLB209]BAP43802.1 putative uncharacterized protein [Pseudomonas sp. StFLB209]